MKEYFSVDNLSRVIKNLWFFSFICSAYPIWFALTLPDPTKLPSGVETERILSMMPINLAYLCSGLALGMAIYVIVAHKQKWGLLLWPLSAFAVPFVAGLLVQKLYS